MKQKLFLMMGFAALLGVFTSCSKDDDEEKKGGSTVLTEESALGILTGQNLWVATSKVDGYEHVLALHFTKEGRITGYDIDPNDDVTRYKDLNFYLIATTAEAIMNLVAEDAELPVAEEADDAELPVRAGTEEAAEETEWDYTYNEVYAIGKNDKGDVHYYVGSLHIIADGNRVEFYDGTKWVGMATDMTLAEFENKYKDELAIVTKEQALNILASSDLWVYEEEDGYVSGMSFLGGKYTSFSFDLESVGSESGPNVGWQTEDSWDLSSNNDSYASGNIVITNIYGKSYDSYRGLTSKSFSFCPSASSTGTEWFIAKAMSFDEFMWEYHFRIEDYVTFP